MDVRTLVLSAGLVSTLIALGATIGVLAFAVPRVLSAWQNHDTIRNGNIAEGRVLSASQTGVQLNQVPQMLLVVRVTDVHGERELRIRQFIDLGNLPRAGERVRLLIDPQDMNRAAYVGPVLSG